MPCLLVLPSAVVSFSGFGLDRRNPSGPAARRVPSRDQVRGHRELAARRLPAGRAGFPGRSEREAPQLEREQPLRRERRDQPPGLLQHQLGEAGLPSFTG